MAIDTTVHEWQYRFIRKYEQYITSTDAVYRPEVYQDYVKEEDVCEFCGNRSKLRDVRGNCIACGANRKEPS